ncbi:hypothetical protein HMPREF3144_03125 [Oligella sp. HMSC05A10]|uniref:DUF1828 domain-containing protein n=1 Tax=Oligella sp. HMSC05A10 TaxID=1581112 RepID=UPI0008A33837|nr:DUF1828 domain-containing protein [Oligella sp. HMSC05A10]OFS87852.1 hypothetical protein HMPREF3144_03125 [Oligella sp. HMSC05A10]
MICKSFAEMTGFECHPLNEESTVVYVATPFTFEDGDTLPLYVEKIANSHIRFFDDGELALHFLGRGLSGAKKNITYSFLSAIASKNNLTFEKNILEKTSSIAEASIGFASYLSALLDIIAWEKENINIDLNIIETIK